MKKYSILIMVKPEGVVEQPVSERRFVLGSPCHTAGEFVDTLVGLCQSLKRPSSSRKGHILPFQGMFFKEDLDKIGEREILMIEKGVLFVPKEVKNG